MFLLPNGGAPMSEGRPANSGVSNIVRKNTNYKIIRYYFFFSTANKKHVSFLIETVHYYRNISYNQSKEHVTS